MRNACGKIRHREDAGKDEVPFLIERRSGALVPLAPNDTLKWGGGRAFGRIVQHPAGWFVEAEYKGRTLFVELISLVGKRITRVGLVTKKAAA